MPRRNRRRGGNTTWSGSSGITSQSRVVLRDPVRLSVPRYLQMFPDEFECWGNTDLQVVPTSSSQSYTFKANSPFNLYGPQLNYAGAFSANVPSGAYYLISSPSVSASVAPYAYCTVMQLEIECEISNSAGNASPVSNWLIVPSESASLSGTVITQLLEQRGVAHMLVPGATTAAGTVVPLSLRNSFSISDLFGITEREVRENRAYACAVGANPSIVAYFHIIAAAYDGVTNMAHVCRVRIRSRYLFRSLNAFTSAVPT